LADNALGAAVTLFTVLISCFHDIDSNLPEILRWIAFVVGVTTIMRNILALWSRKP
jgi:hypothetical protein